MSLLRAFRSALPLASVHGRVLASDASELSAAAWEADGRFVVPRCVDPEFIPEMLSLCERESVDLVVPTIDTELPYFAAHRNAFEAIGTQVLISDPEVVAICSDKVRTNEFLRIHGLPAVEQFPAENVPEDIAAWRYPLIAKPRRGSASAGVHLVSSEAEIRRLPPDYIVERIAAGQEYTSDVYLDSSGQAAVVVPRLRLETRGGEVSKGVTERVPELVDVVGATCNALPGARGVLTIQAFFDEASKLAKVIEINPRFGGGFPLSHRAGANFPLWLVQQWCLGSQNVTLSNDWEEGLTMLRYDDAVFISRRSRS